MGSEITPLGLVDRSLDHTRCERGFVCDLPGEGHCLFHQRLVRNNPVHKAYIEMAVTGFVTDAQSSIFARACQRLMEEGDAQAIVLGGTDLVLAFDGKTVDFPVIDCAAIHADAIAALALL